MRLTRRLGSALAAVLALGAGCPTVEPPAPGSLGERIDLGEAQAVELHECSGLVASRSQPGVLWAHNDSGDEPRLFAIGPRGEDLGRFVLAGAEHVDWEDIAIGPAPDRAADDEAGDQFIYVADIGDNDARRDVKTIYRVAEPLVERAAAPADPVVLRGVESIRLRYPDGPVDAETLLLDPLSGDLYIVTKRSTTVRVLRAAAPLAPGRTTTMTRAGTLDFDPVPRLGRGGQGAVGGDVAPDGSAVLVKSYDAVWLWTRETRAGRMFEGTRVRLPYVPEPQGEAIAFSTHGPPSYLTLSEERERIPARLFAYRLPAP